MAMDFDIKQKEFTDYIRDPERYPAPADVDIRRMAMYRELIFNNVESFLSGNFPVLRAILDDRRWHGLAYGFFANHVCRTPYFAEIAEEFLAYLQNERREPGDAPFSLELAHYEWVEMALANAKAELVVNEPVAGDLTGRTIRLSPLACPLIYQFPVHRLSPSYTPSIPPEQPTCLIVYRNRDDEVQFTEITPPTYSMLRILEDNGDLSSTSVLDQMIRMLQPPEPEIVRQGGLRILKELAEKNIITVLD